MIVDDALPPAIIIKNDELPPKVCKDVVFTVDFVSNIV